MSLISWNCRGIGGPRKQQFLKALLRSTNANICFIAETKCSFHKTVNIFQQMPLENFSFVLAYGRSGGLVLMWDRGTRLQIQQKSRSLIHATVTNARGVEWELLCVYGDANHTRNPQIWRRILQIIAKGSPTCVVGDFNAIADESEKVGGDPIMNKNSRDFKEFLFQGGLIDLGFKGPAFTWTNKRNASEAIYERLDRVVATVGWLQLHAQAYANNLPRIHSDHAAIMLRLNGRLQKKRRFRMESWWFAAEGFREAWENDWRDSRDVTWQDRMSRLGANIREWAKQHRSPQNRLREAQNCLFQNQMLHPHYQDHSLEERCLHEIDKAEKEIEKYWAQRAKLN